MCYGIPHPYLACSFCITLLSLKKGFTLLFFKLFMFYDCTHFLFFSLAPNHIFKHIVPVQRSSLSLPGFLHALAPGRRCKKVSSVNLHVSFTDLTLFYFIREG